LDPHLPLTGSLVVLLATAMATPAAADCIDKDLADKTAYKRERRGRVPRDFVKAQRHEISVSGGYFVSDLYSATYILGGSYTYHMTEDTAVEASGWYTHADAEVVRAIEDGRAQTVRDPYARSLFFASALIWSPLHGKLQLGGSVVHFDLHLDAGVGVVDSPTSRGVTGVGGLGIKLFGGSAFAFRIDLRDLVYQQELLMETFIVNDLSLTAGLSVFLPFGF
jgi:outer membrane beta-barrel protein